MLPTGRLSSSPRAYSAWTATRPTCPPWCAEKLQRHGFYALPVRPPTVPEGTSRIRFSLTAAVRREEVEQLARLIRDSEQPPFPLNHSEK